MVKRSIAPTTWFWNFLGFGLMCLLTGSGWSVSQAVAYKLEAAQLKLDVGHAIFDVKKVSDTLEESARTLPIATEDKQKIQENFDRSNAVLEQAESKIELNTDKLTTKEKE